MLSEEQKYFTNFSSSRALVTIGQGQLHFIAENYLQFANILLEYYTRIGRKQSHGAIREEEIKKMNSLLRPHKITHTHTHTGLRTRALEIHNLHCKVFDVFQIAASVHIVARLKLVYNFVFFVFRFGVSYTRESVRSLKKKKIITTIDFWSAKNLIYIMWQLKGCQNVLLMKPKNQIVAPAAHNIYCLGANESMHTISCTSYLLIQLFTRNSTIYSKHIFRQHRQQQPLTTNQPKRHQMKMNNNINNEDYRRMWRGEAEKADKNRMWIVP